MISFLGLVSYYRKCIKGFSQLAKPLTDLTGDKAVWRRGDADAKSFTALKVVLETAPVLPLTDFEKQFVVTTDASDVAVGAILEQKFGSELQLIPFASRKLNATEIRYSMYDREMLGTVWALGQWKHHFQGPQPIVIQTYHVPLRHLQNQTFVNIRVWRWISILQGYNVEILHIPGKKNPIDSLSLQLISDALVRKGSVKDANEEYMMRLRVAANATDEKIQSALHQLFNSNIQSVQGLQDRSQCRQGKFETTHEDQSPSQISFENKLSIIASTAVSKVQLENSFRNSLYSLLKNEALYDDIITELKNGKTQVVKNNEVYKRMNDVFEVHSHHRDQS